MPRIWETRDGEPLQASRHPSVQLTRVYGTCIKSVESESSQAVVAELLWSGVVVMIVFARYSNSADVNLTPAKDPSRDLPMSAASSLPARATTHRMAIRIIQGKCHVQFL